MKRSIAIQMAKGGIARSLDLSFFMKIDKENFHEKIEYLTQSYLYFFEKAGMVPPILEDKSFIMLDSGEMTYAVHEWEPEDES